MAAVATGTGIASEVGSRSLFQVAGACTQGERHEMFGGPGSGNRP
jgi:hypothetical protein